MTEKKESSSRTFWNMLFSAADPELKELADKIRGMIPENSPLRSKIAERILGIVKGWVESQSFNMSPVAGAVVEKLTDLSDFFVGGETGEKTEKTTKVAQDWMNKFFADAGNRLEKAADLPAELDKIKKEFAARMKLLGVIEAATKKYAEKKKVAEKKPSSAAGPSPEVGEKVDNLIDAWKARAQGRGYTERGRP